MRAGEVLNTSTEEEIVIESGDEYSDSDEDKLAVNEEADATIEEIEEDEGQTVHNERVAKSVQQKAIQFMQTQNVYLDAGEVEEALQIFPRVSVHYYNLNLIMSILLGGRLSTSSPRLVYT